MMKITLKLEELVMLLLCIFLLWNSNAAWYWYLLLLLGPDISMLGYAINNTVGAFSYNFFHHKAVAIIIFLVGMYYNMMWLQQIGIVWFGHSSFDRLLGYGLKYTSGFKYTHLGAIGQTKNKD